MNVVVIGASAPNLARVTAAATSRGLRVVTGAASRPSWVIVATPGQRRDALARFDLPAFRVIEWPGLDSGTEIDHEVLTRGVMRMAELGSYRPVASPAGVALTRWLMPWIMRTLDRAIGPAETVKELSPEEAAARDARMLAKEAELETSEKARRKLAERRAQRKAQRAAAKAGRPQADPPGDEERPR